MKPFFSKNGAYCLVMSPHQVVNNSKTMKAIINVSVKLTENMKMQQKQKVTNNKIMTYLVTYHEKIEWKKIHFEFFMRHFSYS